MKPEIITLANKVLHDLNFDKQRTTTQIVAEAISNYAEQQVKTCNKPAVINCKNMDAIIIKSKNFWEFRKLVKLLYSMGFTFCSGTKHKPINMWFSNIPPVRGVYIKDFEDTGKGLMWADYRDWSNIDYIEFDEFLKLVHGTI